MWLELNVVTSYFTVLYVVNDAAPTLINYQLSSFLKTLVGLKEKEKEKEKSEKVNNSDLYSMTISTVLVWTW